jgi:hypothetical protein
LLQKAAEVRREEERQREAKKVKHYIFYLYVIMLLSFITDLLLYLCLLIPVYYSIYVF